MLDEKQKVQKVLVIGSSDNAALARLGKALAEEGRDFVIQLEKPDSRSALSAVPEVSEVMPEPCRVPRKVESWRVKKGRFKGDFPCYR